MTQLHDVLHISPVAALLVAYNAPKDTLCLLVAGVDGDLHDGVRQLLTHINSATLKTHDEDTNATLVLHCAAAFGCQRAVLRLLQYGDIHAYAATETPLPRRIGRVAEALSQARVEFPAEVLYHAATRGDRETLAWLAPFTRFDRMEAMTAAAASGHMDVTYWLSRMETQERGSDAPVLWLLDEEGGVLCGQWATREGSVFASRGHGVVSLKPQQDAMTKDGFACAMDFVAACGDMALLRRMHQDPRSSWSFTSHAMVAAATNGHLEVLQWLLDSSTEMQDSDHWVVSAAEGAARNGHLEVLQWLPCQATASVFVAALEGGAIHVLQWIHESSGVDPWSLRGLPSRATLMEAACVSANRLQVLEWLEQTTNIRTVTAAAMSYVISQGDVRTAQWLADPMGDGDNLSHWNWVVAKWMSYEFALWHNATLAKAALNGHIEIVRWIAQAGPLHKVDVDTLWRCARSGHLDVVAFLLQNPSHLPKGVEFLPSSWSSFRDSIDGDRKSGQVAWAWHPRATNPEWARPYVELWLSHDARTCRRVSWLREWAIHTGIAMDDDQ